MGTPHLLRNTSHIKLLLRKSKMLLNRQSLEMIPSFWLIDSCQSLWKSKFQLRKKTGRVPLTNLKILPSLPILFIVKLSRVRVILCKKCKLGLKRESLMIEDIAHISLINLLLRLAEIVFSKLELCRQLTLLEQDNYWSRSLANKREVSSRMKLSQVQVKMILKVRKETKCW